ncbi:hypothetical protein HYR53_00385, partial [Candidatus Acetothermia bacterium]|nr:hypothetical protein [Candidatus Acetothermia bacterium]
MSTENNMAAGYRVGSLIFGIFGGLISLGLYTEVQVDNSMLQSAGQASHNDLATFLLIIGIMGILGSALSFGKPGWASTLMGFGAILGFYKLGLNFWLAGIFLVCGAILVEKGKSSSTDDKIKSNDLKKEPLSTDDLNMGVSGLPPILVPPVSRDCGCHSAVCCSGARMDAHAPARESVHRLETPPG